MEAMKSYIAYWGCMIISAVWFASDKELPVPSAWVGAAFFLIAMCFQATHYYKDEQEKKKVDRQP